MSDLSARIATIQMELIINASAGEVWRALMDQIGDWWPDDFYAGGESGMRGFSIEAQPGGRMYEQWESGGGVLWGTVVAIDPEKSLQVLGHLFPSWGGPSQWYGSWELEDEAGKTKLKFSESSLGKVSDDGMEEKDKGWQFLWSNLKAHVEGNPAPEWPDN